MNISIPLERIPIEEEGFHILVRGKINEYDCTFLIDTGASQSVFNKSLIERILDEKLFKPTPTEKLSTGIGTNTLKSEFIFLESLQLGEFYVHHLKAILIDLQHVTQAYEALELPIISGIIGGDILCKYQAIINYQSQILTLTTD